MLEDLENCKIRESTFIYLFKVIKSLDFLISWVFRTAPLLLFFHKQIL